MRRACSKGSDLCAGPPVGFVGFSGNASPAGPHLHFAINRMSPGEKWYQGSPINPYPLLAGKQARRLDAAPQSLLPHRVRRAAL